MSRRTPAFAFLVLALLVPASPAAPATDPDCLIEIDGVNLQTATILDLQDAMSRSEDPLTSEELVARYLERIAFFDTGGPTLNSVREVNPHALEEARGLDVERAAGIVRGPLHGIPVMLKDNVGTVDMPTTAGSIALAGSIPLRDAFTASRLREAGAIILAKTNLSEFANWVDLSMPSGYSSLGGQVVNAYRFSDTPSGSSSGSGVAGSMALAAAAVGTETSGSIISPSFANSLVGIKPTLGLTSRDGVIPLAPSFDVVGPMTRNVTDAAVMLGAMTGIDARDPATAEQAGHVPPGADYTPALDDGRLLGARLGVDPDDRPSGEAGQLWDRALDHLRAAGAEIVTIDLLQEGRNVGITEIAAIPNEFKASLNAYLAEHPVPPSGVRTLSDIIEYNEQHPEQVRYGQNLLIASDATAGNMTLGEPNRIAAVEGSRVAIDQAFIRYDLDAVVSMNSQYVNVGAAAGYPTITVPMGYVQNGRLPRNLSFLGRAWDEPELIGYAYAFEQRSSARVPPTAVNPDLFPDGCAAPGGA